MSIKSLSATTKNYLILGGFIVFSLLTYYLSNVVAPFLISLVIAYVLNPFARFLVDHRFPRPWAVLTIFILCISIFVLVVVPLTVSIISEAGEMVNRVGRINVNDLAENFKNIGQNLYDRFSEVPLLKEQIDNFVQSDRVRELAAQGVILVKDSTVTVFSQLISFLLSAFSGMVNMFLIPILVFYVLLDMDEIYEGFNMLVPPDYRVRVALICGKMNTQLNSLLRGQLFANTIFASMMTLGLWLCGLNFFMFLGPLSGIANFIPYLGGLFTTVFATLVAITQFGISYEFLSVIIRVAIAIGLIQTIDVWYLQPYVVGENAGLHPLVVMLALAIAGSLAGIPGMLLAVPTTVILKVIGRELYHELYDQLEHDTADATCNNSQGA